MVNTLPNIISSHRDKKHTAAAKIEELELRDQLRRELIANISHDLRSPLTSIKGYLETIQIKDEDLAPQERQQYVDTILNNTNMLEKLVEQLFELSKLDLKQTQPCFEPFSISDLVQDVVMKFMPVAEKAKINLHAVIPEKLPQVYADIGLIERALSNLIENALSHTSEQGEVLIGVVQKQDKVRIKLSDTGCGIPAEDLPYIFNRFYRVEKSTHHSSGGAGLGLVITQKIIEAHNNCITVESVVDAGTTFTFELETFDISKHSPTNN
jgi:signal transduction histidine kinase